MHLKLPQAVERLIIAEPQPGTSEILNILFALFPKTENHEWLSCIAAKVIDECRVYQFGSQEERGCPSVFRDNRLTCYKLGMDNEEAMLIPCKTRHRVLGFSENIARTKLHPGFVHTIDLDIMQLYCAMRMRPPLPTLPFQTLRV